MVSDQEKNSEKPSEDPFGPIGDDDFLIGDDDFGSDLSEDLPALSEDPLDFQESSEKPSEEVSPEPLQGVSEESATDSKGLPDIESDVQEDLDIPEPTVEDLPKPAAKNDLPQTDIPDLELSDVLDSTDEDLEESPMFPELLSTDKKPSEPSEAPVEPELVDKPDVQPIDQAEQGIEPSEPSMPKEEPVQMDIPEPDVAELDSVQPDKAQPDAPALDLPEPDVPELDLPEPEVPEESTRKKQGKKLGIDSKRYQMPEAPEEQSGVAVPADEIVFDDEQFEKELLDPEQEVPSSEDRAGQTVDQPQQEDSAKASPLDEKDLSYKMAMDELSVDDFQDEFEDVLSPPKSEQVSTEVIKVTKVPIFAYFLLYSMMLFLSCSLALLLVQLYNLPLPEPILQILERFL